MMLQLADDVSTRQGSPRIAFPQFPTLIPRCHTDAIQYAYDSQLTDRSIRCIGLALCDAEGTPITEVPLGSEAIVLAEFFAYRELDAVTGEIEVRNASQLVYGFPAWESPEPFIPAPTSSKVRLQFQLAMELKPDTYSITFNLYTCDASTADRYRSGEIASEGLRSLLQPRCHLAFALMFRVVPTDQRSGSFRGLADLRAQCWSTRVVRPVDASSASPAALEERFEESATASPPPSEPAALMHVTHWKAGSQWVRRILQQTVRERIVRPQADDYQVHHWPIQAGMIYPSLYLQAGQVDRLRLPNPTVRLVVIRDLRDALVSTYFSWRYSHDQTLPSAVAQRRQLEAMSIEDGLIWLLMYHLPAFAEIQFSWLESGVRIHKFENLIENDVPFFQWLLIDQCRYDITREAVQEVVLANRFDKLGEGRQRGEEDRAAHYRKGIHGDWKNHFTRKIKRLFKNRYGALLIATGYERDLTW